jgi:hypothetical protein
MYGVQKYLSSKNNNYSRSDHFDHDHNNNNNHDDSTSNTEYEIVEEEVVETLMNGDDTVLADLRAFRKAHTEYVVEEEEVVEEEDDVDEIHGDELPEIYEDDDNDSSGSEYTEEEIFQSSVGSNLSLTEVEIIDDDEDDFRYQKASYSRNYPNYTFETIEDEDTELAVECMIANEEEEIVEEETVHEEDDDHGDNNDHLAQVENLRQGLGNSCQIQDQATNNSSTAKKSSAVECNPEDDEDEEDCEGASAEELAEAIEYILRQEKAVSKFILTEEQAHTMTHLPVKVMKVIVDHLEMCDNEGASIDWDFLLKIVLPFCDDERAGDENSDVDEY